MRIRFGRRKRLTLALAGAAVIGVGAVGMALGVHDAGFQLEGNATAGDLTYVNIDKTGNTTTRTPGTLEAPFDGAYDWDSLFTITGSPAVGNAEGVVTGLKDPLPGDFTAASFQKDFGNTGTTFLTSDSTTFATGSKDTLPISGWQCNQDNNVNSKTDIINGFAALQEQPGGSKILYFGLEKDVDNGDNNVGFWLLQDGNVNCTSSGGAADFTGEHQEGDLFVVSAFTNGGGVSDVSVYQWVNDANSHKAGDQPGIDPNPVAQGVDCLDSGPSDEVCATVNGKTIRMPWLSADSGTINADKLSPNFFEGAINLDAFEQFQGRCYGDFVLNTRSSQQLGATLFDYVRGSLNTCHPELSLQKTPDSGTYFVGDSFNWTLQVANTGNGDATGAVVTDTIPTGLTINSATTPAGSCSVNGQDVSCTIDVAEGGSATITINVTATSAVLGTPTACQTVNNTATVSVDGDRDPSDDSDSGSVSVCPITVTKDASTSYTRTFNWTIDKSVTPDTWDLFTGETGTSDWTVSVDQTDYTDSDWAVSGNITVHNPAPIDATINGVGDVLATDGAATVDCGVTFPYVLAAGADLDCSYSLDPTAANDQLNTATATLANTPSGTTDFTGTADVTFGDPTTLVNDTINVTDDNGLSETATGDDSWTYSEDFTCNGDEGQHDNTATITETGQEADASVTVNCHELTVTKDASTSYTRTFNWTIDKSVTPDTWDLFTGETGTSDWTVSVDQTDYTDSDWAVSGNITVHNDTPIDATINGVGDVLATDGAATVDCGVTYPYTLAAGAHLDCTYSMDLPDANDQLNTATATRQNHDYASDGTPSDDGTADITGTADVEFGSATVTNVNDTINVTDDNGLSETATGDDSWTYSEDFTCNGDEGQHDNTATITETGQEADASVTVNCHELTVTKDASTSYTRTFNWTIDKSVTPDTWDLFTGETGTSDWTVSVDQTDYTDSDWAVSGNITVHNDTPIDATINGVGDVLATDGAATVDCGVTYPYTLAAGAHLDCTYSMDLPDANDQLNTATATRQNHDYASDGTPSDDGTADITGTADVEFGSATVTNVNDTINVTDDNGLSETATGDDSWTYSEDFTCNGDEGQHDNTATITETGQEADASVTVNCHELTVTKDASTSYTRTFNWTIDKFSDDPNGGALTLNPGETYVDYPYSVRVNLGVPAYTDSDWAVSGNITVHNDTPIDATINGVGDVLATDGAATVDCGVTYPYTLAAGAHLDCTYSMDLPDANDQLNTATATRQNHDYASDGTPSDDGTADITGTADVEFGAPTSLVDESINVVDDYGTPGDTSDDRDFGTVTYTDTLPRTFTYMRTFGPFDTNQCGQVTIDNTATLTTNDTSTEGSDHWPLVITIPCPTGCTLTQGYWKTHSEFGPAPEDPNWYNLPGGLGPNTVFFTSGQTWYQVFWTPPKRGNAYYILAHQYEAAVLNHLSPADAPQSVLDAIAWSETFFSNHSPSDKLSKTVRADAIHYAGILGSYNEGTIGPGHCSEDSISISAPS